MTAVLAWVLLGASAVAAAAGGLMHDPLVGAPFLLASVGMFALGVVCIVAHAAKQPIVRIDRS